MTVDQLLLQQFIELKVPIAEPKEIGFLEIVGQSTKENPISNVYRHFLDPELSPELSSILIDSLLGLINVKLKILKREVDLQLDEYSAIREYQTGNGRIDLVIESQKGRSVIIIEAKIYHSIENDLNDYWNAFEYPESKKVGILLSLKPISSKFIGHDKFINITHAEWLNQAKTFCLPYSLSAKSFIYFTDFFTTMQNLTTGNELTAEVQFYLDYHEKIEAAISCRNSATNFIIQQLDKVCRELGWSLYGTAEEWRNLWDESYGKHVYWTVYPMDILRKKGGILIILEIDGDARKHEIAIREEFEAHWQELGFTAIINKEKHVVHLASISMPFDLREMNQISDKLVEYLKNELEPVRRRLVEFIDKLAK